MARVPTRTVLLLFLLACCGFALDPSLEISQYAHNTWKVRDGFGKGFFLSIAQTPDGYLWLGTDSGLLRFDGVRAVMWQPPAGQQLPATDIPTLLVTRDGALWIGTANGLARWKDGKLITWAELSGQRISSVLQDRAGTVWIGSRVENRTGKLCAFQNERIQCHDDIFGSAVRSLYEDSGGNLLVGVNSGFWRWKPGRSAFFALSEELAEGSIGEDNQSAILIGTQVGISRFTNGRVEPYRLPGLPQRFRASRILRDRDGGLWIATLDRGLVHYHQGKTDVFSEADGLSGDSVTDIFEDREGNVWAATQNGLDRFRGYAAPRIDSRHGLSNTAIESLLAANDGSVWIATFNGLNRWKDGRISVFGRGGGASSRGGTLNELTHCLFQDSHGRIWVSTSRETGYLENDRFVPVLHFRDAWVYSIAEAPSGNIWVANDPKGLLHLIDGSVVENIPWAVLGHKDYARVLLADPSRRGLWLGFAQGGVLHFADGRIRESYSAAEGLGGGMVNGLRFGADGALWAATAGGLSRIRDGRITTLTSRNGMPCETAHWSMEDDDHSLWLYTACGIVRIARPELDTWVADPAKSVKATLFDASDGVRSPSYSSQLYSATRSSDGRIWFAGFDGVSVINPHRLAFNDLPPAVHIEQVLGDGKKYDIARGLRLAPLVRNLAFDFMALSLVAPEKNRYRFKLEGWDSDWRDTVNEFRVEYTNLPPRNYRFRVIACNNSGVWNEEGASLDFVIPPAWYQTNWFRALCVAAFLALLWAAYRLRVAELEAQERKFREAVETMPAVAFIARPDGYHTFFNRPWVEYTGIPLAQAMGSGWQAALYPEDLKRVIEKWQKSAAKGEPLEYEARLRRSVDGEYRWFQTRAAPLRDKHGKVMRWCGVANDVEDRKRAEQLQAELAHTNRVSLLGELAASISHELKQPITGAMANARASVRWLTRDQPDVQEALDAIGKIERDGARATQIIDRLRSLYKKTPPQRTLVDVNELLSEMVALLRGEAYRHAVSIRVDPAADLAKITADRVQLQQVLMNLMLNAIEAMKETGGVLTVKSQRDENGRVLISVSDTGVGLPADKVDQIFEAFFTTKPQGSGMGLAISRSIVESHGGRLWATPNDGRGATFSFTLPCEIEAHAQERTRPPQEVQG